MTSAPASRHLSCSICSQLSDQEHALEHVQGDEDDTELPEAVKRLEMAREIRRGCEDAAQLEEHREVSSGYHFDLLMVADEL